LKLSETGKRMLKSGRREGKKFQNKTSAARRKDVKGCWNQKKPTKNKTKKKKKNQKKKHQHKQNPKKQQHTKHHQQRHPTQTHQKKKKKPKTKNKETNPQKTPQHQTPKKTTPWGEQHFLRGGGAPWKAGGGGGTGTEGEPGQTLGIEFASYIMQFKGVFLSQQGRTKPAKEGDRAQGGRACSR